MKIFIVLALIAFVSAARLPSAERQIIREWQMQPRSQDDDDKIVGGSYVSSDTAHPYIVSLRRYGSHICGASIIRYNKILTAAHCTSGQSSSSLEVAAGDVYINNWDQKIGVSYYNQHSKYNSATTNYDFSMLTLKSFLTSTSHVKTIGLVSTGDENVGKWAVISGWGATNEGGSAAYKLKSISLPIISNSECDNNYGSGAITSQMICAGYMDRSGQDSCQGDSGGPMTVSGRLVGVVSWGYGCARYGYPGVYARISSVKSWVLGF